MKEKITTGLFLGIIFIFFVLHLLLPDQDISTAERRHLEQFSPPDAASVASGKWMKDFEDYSLDQFPGRDAFRSIKANAMFHLFHLQDNNNLYLSQGHIVKMEYPLNESSLDRFISKLDTIQKQYLKDNRVYAAVIPDKNYFVKDHHLRMDYDHINEKLRQSLPDMTWISLWDVLSLDNYYLSDLHWKQEKLQPVVERLEETMDFQGGPFPQDCFLYQPFYGGYYGQAALPFTSETITCMTSPQIEQCTVWNVEKNRTEPIYVKERLNGMDSYDVYLSGASPLLVVENPQVKNGRELILFRDSFGSSLTPLLVNAYEKITLIDLRYIPMEMVDDYVDFSHQDVLFLYSTTLINNSFSLK